MKDKTTHINFTCPKCCKPMEPMKVKNKYRCRCGARVEQLDLFKMEEENKWKLELTEK